MNKKEKENKLKKKNINKVNKKESNYDISLLFDDEDDFVIDKPKIIKNIESKKTSLESNDNKQKIINLKNVKNLHDNVNNFPKSEQKEEELTYESLLAPSFSQTSDNSSNSSALSSNYLAEHLSKLSSYISNDNFYSHLFTKEDKIFLNDFNNLKSDQRSLYVKLLLRKPLWFRLEQLENNANFSNGDLNSLLSNGFLFQASSKTISLENILNLMNLKEIKELGKELKIKLNKNLKKIEILSLIIKQSQVKTIKNFFQVNKNNQDTSSHIKIKALKKIGICVKLDLERKKIILMIIILSFIHNCYSDDKNSSLDNIKLSFQDYWRKIKYPEYKINKKKLIFQTRFQFDKFYELLEVEDSIIKVLKKKKNGFYCYEQKLKTKKEGIDDYEMIKSHLPDWVDNFMEKYNHLLQEPLHLHENSELPSQFKRFQGPSIYTKLLLRLSFELESSGYYNKALEVFNFLLSNDYSSKYRGKIYDRLVLDSDFHCKDPQNALEIVFKSLQDQKVKSGYRLNLFLKGKKIIEKYRKQNNISGQSIIKKNTKKKIINENNKNIEAQNSYEHLIIKTERLMEEDELNCLTDAPSVELKGTLIKSTSYTSSFSYWFLVACKNMLKLEKRKELASQKKENLINNEDENPFTDDIILEMSQEMSEGTNEQEECERNYGGSHYSSNSQNQLSNYEVMNKKSTNNIDNIKNKNNDDKTFDDFDYFLTGDFQKSDNKNSNEEHNYLFTNDSLKNNINDNVYDDSCNDQLSIEIFKELSQEMSEETIERVRSENKKKRKIEEVYDIILPSQLIDDNNNNKSINSEEVDEEDDDDDNYKEEEIKVTRVEQVALNHYLNNGYNDGLHGEGLTLSSLFFILFWDEIYDDNIPDVFINPFQVLPLDFRSESFYEKRKEKLDNKLQFVSMATENELDELIRRCWYEHHDLASSPWLHWSLFYSYRQAQKLCKCIGGKRLSKLMERLVKDMRSYFGGVPDLVVWNWKEKKVKFIEVKGPRDKLSSKQILWLHYLISCGIEAEVCWVKS